LNPPLERSRFSEPGAPARAVRAFRRAWKPLLLALLVFDTGYYAVAGTTSKAVDAAAWLVLLVLFEFEARLAHVRGATSVRSALRLARLMAGAGVIAATVGYVFEDDVIDAINSALWIAVVVLLEVEFRYPAAVARARPTFAAIAAVLYGGLALLVAAWALRGEWFDAYDALLWLVAFAAIELRAVGVEARAA
jgi:hypothetical protein